MVKILRATTAGKQPTPVRSTSTSQAIEVSKNVLRPVPMFRNKVQSVRILFQPDPNNYNKLSTKTQATFSPVASGIMSTNPNYDPSGNVSSPTIKAVSKSAQRAGKASRGHQNVISYNNQQRTGGKTLKRR